MSEAAEQQVASMINKSMGADLTQGVNAQAEPPEPASDATYEYDAAFQSRIAALTLRDALFNKRVKGLVKPEYFDDPAEQYLVHISNEFYDKYQRALSDPAILMQVLKDEIAQRRLRPDLLEQVKPKIKELLGSDMSSREFVIDKVSGFARRRAVEAAILKCADQIEKGSYDSIEELIAESMRVGASKASEAYDYFEAIEARTQYRKDIKSGKIRPNGVSTGITALDNLLFHKGWGRGELSIIMGAAKRGKTTAIWDFGKRASLMGLNVLGITLEVSTDVISARIDANISNTKMGELNDHILDVEEKVKRAAKKAGRYIMHEFPAGSFTPLDMQALIEDYKSQGIVFDMVVVDYLDIMAPSKWMPNDIANSKSIWTEMRGIAQTEGFAMLSATQTNRDGAKKTVADDTSVAEDYNKIRIADITISINATDDELAAGEARLYFAASRNQKGKVTVKVKQNLEMMQFITDVIGVQ